MVAAIVLAAGTSSRYGANKLLLPFDGGTVISTVVSTVLQSAARPIVVVTGHQAAQVEQALQSYAGQVTFTHNPDYQSGEMLSSVKAGVRRVQEIAAAPGDPATALLMVLGDQPLLRLDVMQRLLVAYEQNCGQLIAPRLGADGPRGHPVLIGREWWGAVLALPPDGNVRDLLRANRESVTHLVVNSDSILGDVDTPEAYQAALAARREMLDSRPVAGGA